MSRDAQLASQGVSSSTKRRTDSNELGRAVDHACELGRAVLATTSTSVENAIWLCQVHPAAVSG